MFIIELTKAMDWQNTRADKKLLIMTKNVMSFEEIPNGNGCTAIRYTNGSELHVRETYAQIKEMFGL
jgi:hypothetical protein